MGTQSTPDMDELVSKYAFGYTRLSDCEKGVFLEQMREKMSNFEESLLRSVIEENKEMKKRLEAKEKEDTAKFELAKKLGCPACDTPPPLASSLPWLPRAS